MCWQLAHGQVGQQQRYFLGQNLESMTQWRTVKSMTGTLSELQEVVRLHSQEPGAPYIVPESKIMSGTRFSGQKPGLCLELVIGFKKSSVYFLLITLKA